MADRAQFVRLEVYPWTRGKAHKRADSRFVLSEAARVPWASRHVDEPRKPVPIGGMSPLDVLALLDTAVPDLKDRAGRRLKCDAVVLAGVVASHPDKSADVADPAVRRDVEDWALRSYEHHVRLWGDDAQATGAVLHLDEAQAHVHVYGVPRDFRAVAWHPGKVAQADTYARGIAAGDAPKKAGADARDAYRTAMRLYQDVYWNDVGSRHGLARIGPRRQRLSREEWMTRIRAGQQLQQALTKADATSRVLAALASEHGLTPGLVDFSEVAPLLQFRP